MTEVKHLFFWGSLQLIVTVGMKQQWFLMKPSFCLYYKMATRYKKYLDERSDDDGTKLSGPNPLMIRIYALRNNTSERCNGFFSFALV